MLRFMNAVTDKPEWQKKVGLGLALDVPQTLTETPVNR